MYLTELKYYSQKEAFVYLKAYDYFCINKNEFDGSTASKDLYDLYNLDLDAMLHDFWYIVYNVGANWSMVAKADRLFSEEISRKLKSSKVFGIFVVENFYSWYKLTGLQLLRPRIIIRSRIKRGRMTELQIEDFLNDYYTLMA